jgi:hypothetical protein
MEDAREAPAAIASDLFRVLDSANCEMTNDLTARVGRIAPDQGDGVAQRETAVASTR